MLDQSERAITIQKSLNKGREIECSGIFSGPHLLDIAGDATAYLSSQNDQTWDVVIEKAMTDTFMVL